MIKKILIAVVVLILLLVTYLVIRRQFTETVAYQIDRLEHGSTAEKMHALYFLGKQDTVHEMVPLFMKHIDDESRDFWGGEPKAGYTAVSCAVTEELESMTGFYYDNHDEGNTCGFGKNGSERDNEKIKQWWKDWYKNEYQKWLEEHKK